MLGFVPPLPQQPGRPPSSGHMIVCGDDALARRLAVELRFIYGERVTLLLPPGRDASGPQTPMTQRGRAAALFGRMSAAMNRAGNGNGATDGSGDTNAGVEAVRIMEAPEPSDDVLEEAGIDRAAALALVYDDDERNIRAALTARRFNPRLRLVIRLYNRKLGQHLEELLDQAAAVAMPGIDPALLDASTTVLSDADTAAPACAPSPCSPPPPTTRRAPRVRTAAATRPRSSCPTNAPSPRRPAGAQWSSKRSAGPTRTGRRPAWEAGARRSRRSSPAGCAGRPSASRSRHSPWWPPRSSPPGTAWSTPPI